MPEKTRWRLYGSHFRGPGPYRFACGGDALSVEVDAAGYFEAERFPAVPLYAYAGLAGALRAQTDAQFRDEAERAQASRPPRARAERIAGQR